VYYSKVGGDKKCWIGLYKSVAEVSDTSTYWLDGNNSTYRTWRGGEPNSVDRCIHIDNGKFRDESCSATYRYVCKGIYCPLKSYLSLTLFGSQWGRLSRLSVSFERTTNLACRRITCILHSLCVINRTRMTDYRIHLNNTYICQIYRIRQIAAVHTIIK